MKDIYVSYILFVLFAVKLIYDFFNNYKECIQNHPGIILLITLHAALWIFSLFGFLYSDKKKLRLYLILYCLLVIHWLLNNNKCELTLIVNRTCNLSDNQSYENPTNNEFLNTIITIIRISGFFIGFLKFLKNPV